MFRYIAFVDWNHDEESKTIPFIVSFEARVNVDESFLTDLPFKIEHSFLNTHGIVSTKLKDKWSHRHVIT